MIMRMEGIFYTTNSPPTDGVWRPHQRDFAIGRAYNCNPSMGERYYLRLLLVSVPALPLLNILGRSTVYSTISFRKLAFREVY